MEPERQRRLDELIGAHLDGALDVAGSEELLAIISADSDARRDFARSVAFDTVLPRVARRPRLRIVHWSGIAAAAALLVGIGVWTTLTPGTGPVIEGDSTVAVVRDGGELTLAAAGALRDGDQLRVVHGTAALRWPDEGTRMVLGTGSVLALVHAGPSKEVDLQTGWVDVAAGHQTGERHLTVRTAQAAVEVVGTRFTVANVAGTSAIDVTEGAVAVSAGGAKQTVASGQRAVVAASGGLQIASRDSLAVSGSTGPGAHLDLATYQAEQGRGWDGTPGPDGLIAVHDATAERVTDPRLPAGYAHLWPDLVIEADVTLARPGTLALFLVCRRPDGSDWTGNYTVQKVLPAGRHQRIWTIADLRPEKGSPLADALGARITKVAVCAWTQPVGLVVHQVVVRNAGADSLRH